MLLSAAGSSVGRVRERRGRQRRCRSHQSGTGLPGRKGKQARRTDQSVSFCILYFQWQKVYGDIVYTA